MQRAIPTWSNGFTLIELMIVVAIVAIIGSIAYPAYTNHVRESRRAEAEKLLLENAQFLEQQKTLSGAYNEDGNGNTINASSLPNQEYEKGGTQFYNLGTNTLNANQFVLTATPQNDQTSDPCGTLQLDETGDWSSGGSGPDCR